MTDEIFRHQCLVRWVLAMRVKDRATAHRFLNGYENNGKWVMGWNQRHPKSNLEKDAIDQWAKGNRGAWGDWR